MDVKNYIKVFDNVVDVEQISHLIKWLNTQDFYEAKVGHNPIINKNIRRAHELWLSNQHEKLSNVHWHNYLASKFKALSFEYQKFFKENMCITRIEEIVALKYTEGDYYKVHTDNGTNTPRTLSIILFLNNDYEGGNVIFKCSYTHEEIARISPRCGRVIIFPSNFLFPHVVENIKKGIRYTVVSWIR